MCSIFEAFRLIVLVQIAFTKVVLFPQAQLKQDKCKGFIFYPAVRVYIVIVIPVCCVIFVLFPVRHTGLQVCEFV